MLLGDVIARFEDEAVVTATLLSIEDLALTARVTATASECGISVGELSMQLIGRFVHGAGDEEWLTLIGQMSRSNNPGQVFLRRALSAALSMPAAA